MPQMDILLFYLACFFISFFLAIPIGPVNLEVFHSAVQKHYAHALTLALGAAFGDALWATAAFFGITPFLKNGHNTWLEGAFLLLTSGITLVLGLIALKDARLVERFEKREEEIASKIKRKRWALLKGLTMVLVNPLGIASWMIALSFLKKLNLKIPLELRYEALFVAVVILGAASYFSAIVLITSRMKRLFSPERTCTIIKVLGWILILFSLYFIFFSIKAFFPHLFP
jgi:threonine/homoserine/homoserine lactone efflux protein